MLTPAQQARWQQVAEQHAAVVQCRSWDLVCPSCLKRDSRRTPFCCPGVRRVRRDDLLEQLARMLDWYELSKS